MFWPTIILKLHKKYYDNILAACKGNSILQWPRGSLIFLDHSTLSPTNCLYLWNFNEYLNRNMISNLILNNLLTVCINKVISGGKCNFAPDREAEPKRHFQAADHVQLSTPTTDRGNPLTPRPPRAPRPLDPLVVGWWRPWWNLQ